MGIRLAGIDLDGTLYGRRARVSLGNKLALRQWHQSGRQLAICSGRMPQRVARLISELEVSAYRLCLNGALVEAPDGRRLAARQLKTDIARQVFKIARQYGVRVRFYGDRYHILTAPLTRPVLMQTAGWTRDLRVHDMTSFEQLLAHPDVQLYKFTVAPAWGNLIGYWRALGQLKQLPIHLTRSRAWLSEGMAPGVNKLTGMRIVCADAGLTLADCVAFGDQQNDLELIAATGLGVAMKNATRRVRDAANLIAPRNTADGVAVILYRLIQQSPL